MTSIDLYSELYQLGNSKFAPGTDSYTWQDDAACHFSPPENFEYLEADPKKKEVQGDFDAENEKRFQVAKLDCDRCPVWHLCYSSATPGDFEYSVRAGLKPAPTPSPTSSAKKRNPPFTRGVTCRSGHDEWVVHSAKRGTVRCNPCHKAAVARRKAGVKPYKPGEGKCRKGHDNWAWSGNGERGVTPYCKTCKKIRRRGLDPAKVKA